MLDKKQTQVHEERSSRKEPLTDAEAQQLLDGADSVLVAKGKKVRSLTGAEASLDDLRGPTGNFRAPIVKSGRQLLVGFNQEALEELL